MHETCCADAETLFPRDTPCVLSRAIPQNMILRILLSVTAPSRGRSSQKMSLFPYLKIQVLRSFPPAVPPHQVRDNHGYVERETLPPSAHRSRQTLSLRRRRRLPQIQAGGPCLCVRNTRSALRSSQKHGSLRQKA